MRRKGQNWFQRHVLITAVCLLFHAATYVVAETYRVSGRVIDGTLATGLTNVEVHLYYVPLDSTTNDQTTFVATNTDVNGEYAFEALPGELEGHVRILELPTGYVTPMKETIRLSTLNPTNEAIFRASSAAVLTGSVAITSGTTDLTKFAVEVNATETNVAADGTFIILELPASQQTARLIYQDGYYFDERVISLPSMTAGQTNSMQIPWHEPIQNLTASGVLRDVNGNVLTGALIQFLGRSTGVFVGMKTDANGNYAIYDLPADCYAVRAFVGRWGVEQRTLSAADSILCVGNGGGGIGDGIPDGWRLHFFGSTTTNSESCASCDPDGDGMSNMHEYLAGTDPTNRASAFRIVSAAREASDLRVTWTTVGGHSYVLQTNAPPPSGSYTNNFTDFTSVIAVPGNGESLTNYLDLGAGTNTPSRYYRVRLVP